MHRARLKRAVQLAITTYRYPRRCPPGHVVRSAHIGDTYHHVGHIAGWGRHIRSPDCAGRPETAGDHGHEKDLLLDDRSRRSVSRPRSVLPQGLHYAGRRRIDWHPGQVSQIRWDLRDHGVPDDNHICSDLQDPAVVVGAAAAPRDIAAPAPSAASLLPASFAAQTGVSAFAGASAEPWPGRST